MNNQDYGHITPELLDQVKAVLEDAASHKYSTSKVYGAHNQVFQLMEKPESCASCLRKRSNALKTWYADYLLAQTDANVNADLSLLNEGGHIDPAKFAELSNRDNSIMIESNEADYTEVTGEPIAQVKDEAPALKLTDKDGNAVDAVFTSEDGVKGILNTLEGKAVKPGTYTTAEGATYTVQPGGKATLKDDLL